MQTNLVSWNPSSRSQFISYSKDKLHLLEFYTRAGTEIGGADRSVRELNAWDAPQLLCMDWRSPVDGPILAYGTTAGSVHLLNTKSGDEVGRLLYWKYCFATQLVNTILYYVTDICDARNETWKETM